MIMARAQLAAAGAIMQRDLQIYMSYRLRLVTQVFGIVFSLTLFYYISRLIRIDVFGSADAYFAFVVVGIVILQALNSTLTSPPTMLHSELVAGTFERVVVSPFGPVGGIVSMMLFPFAHAFVVGVVTLAIGGVAFGLPLQWDTAPFALPVAALAAIAFAPFGVLLAGLLLVAKQAAIGTNVLVALTSLVAGLYFPVALLPDWIEWASAVQPFTPAVDLLRHLLMGTPMQGPVWEAVARLAGFAVVLLPLSAFALSAAVRYARRRATLIEF